jgi:hypothetical protein
MISKTEIFIKPNEEDQPLGKLYLIYQGRHIKNKLVKFGSGRGRSRGRGSLGERRQFNTVEGYFLRYVNIPLNSGYGAGRANGFFRHGKGGATGSSVMHLKKIQNVVIEDDA